MENEEIVKQQPPPDYNTEIITTLIAFGMIVIFFVLQNIAAPKDILSLIVFGIWILFQQLATILIFIFAMVSWITSSQTLKTFFMIVSIITIAFFLLILMVILL